jgi:hypothetical protein
MYGRLIIEPMKLMVRNVCCCSCQMKLASCHSSARCLIDVIAFLGYWIVNLRDVPATVEGMFKTRKQSYGHNMEGYTGRNLYR